MHVWRLLILLTCFLSTATCSSVFAECELPVESDYPKYGVVSYSHSHDIFEPVEGNTKADDVLEVWSKKQTDALCFFATFVTDYNHLCFVGGKAVKTGANEYAYSENKCLISIKFLDGKVKFAAHGSDGDGCSPEDLSEDNGCGFNTSIEAAVFVKNDSTTNLPSDRGK